MIDQQIKEKMSKAIDHALGNKAQGCDVIVSSGNSLSLSSQQAKIDKFDISSSQVFGIRVAHEDRIGLAFSESLDDDSLLNTVDMAIENAKNSDPKLAENFNLDKNEVVESDNGKILKKDSYTTQDKIDLCLKLESEVKAKDKRVSGVPYNGLSDNEYQYYYMNSPGSFCFQEERSVSCYTSALINEDQLSSMHYHSVVARDFNELEWQKTIDESLKHASGWLHGKSIASGKYKIVFTPNALGSLLGGFGNVFSAKAAMQKSNPWAEKLGQSVTSELLTIKDVPTYDQSFIYTTFDDEGIKRNELTLVENGELKSFYHNSVTANHFQTKTTGHASRSAKSSLGVSGTTKVISTGNSSSNQVYNGEILEVHAMDGLHSGIHPVSGEFSVAVRGYLKKDGEVIQAVKGITLAGNFLELLNNVELVGNELLSNSSKTFFTPAIQFSGLSVAGS